MAENGVGKRCGQLSQASCYDPKLHHVTEYVSQILSQKKKKKKGKERREKKKKQNEEKEKEAHLGSSVG